MRLVRYGEMVHLRPFEGSQRRVTRPSAVSQSTPSHWQQSIKADQFEFKDEDKRESRSSLLQAAAAWQGEVKKQDSNVSIITRTEQTMWNMEEEEAALGFDFGVGD